MARAVPSPITEWCASAPGRSVFGKWQDGQAVVVLVDTHKVAATESAPTIEEAMAKCLNSLEASRG
jgi:hypothetical protein